MNKIAIATTMAEGAREIHELRKINMSQAERLDLVYAMLKHGGALPDDPTGYSHRPCIASALERASDDLRAEYKAEAPAVSPAEHHIVEEYHQAMTQAFSAAQGSKERLAFLDIALTKKRAIRDALRSR